MLRIRRELYTGRICANSCKIGKKSDIISSCQNTVRRFGRETLNRFRNGFGSALKLLWKSGIRRTGERRRDGCARGGCGQKKAHCVGMGLWGTNV